MDSVVTISRTKVSRFNGLEIPGKQTFVDIIHPSVFTIFRQSPQHEHHTVVTPKLLVSRLE